jgi:isoleucyl-tRNA synthetase
MFPPVPKNETFPDRELAVLRFWKEREIYHKSLAARVGAPEFVFYEGPPTANGMPHPGHCLTRAVKDLFPRYKTMRGYRCERKAGWDTHGLPVEVEVCKELGIHAKEEIEAYGVEPFIQKCQASVWRYMQEWERLTERIGFWVDLEQAYVTYHQSYVESVWWSLKNLFDRGLLYKGHKIVWWWAQGGTSLSSGEVGLGYREVADPSVYVKFPLLDESGKTSDQSLLVWTTTPWTLPSNQFAAVHPDLEYSFICEDVGSIFSEQFVVASALVDSLSTKLKRNFVVSKKCRGADLIGRRYLRPFESVARPASSVEWTVLPAEFVTTDSGTGIVHIAPAFGEDDFSVLTQQRTLFGGRSPQLINCVAPDGKFTSEAPEFCRGRWVKDCDKDIIRDLKSRGLLFHQEQYLHDYPFCWRAEEDPLIQYPRESWFIRTTAFKDAMLANNARINWMPEHIRDGRFGKFLESNVDWALSRERFWGTPLPIWVCEQSGQMEAVASYEELLAKPGVAGTEVWAAAKKSKPDLPEDLKVHKPYIDAVTYDSPFAPGARMRRVTEVIDCWYDSGAMPFAQWGYPKGEGGRGKAEGSPQKSDQSPSTLPLPFPFPADFISEAIDQTRGWFYSQLAISTMLFGKGSEVGGQRSGDEGDSPTLTSDLSFPHPFRNCIVLGLMLGEDGQKMSKSKRNYREPAEIFDKYGADALRWYFFANQPPWTSIRYSEQAIKDSVPEFLLRLWNVYSFFTIYGNIDGFDPSVSSNSAASRGVPSPGARLVAQRSELDRWILSELHRTCAVVVERMDRYDNFAACQAITEFVDALSNWYVRRSRDRFWAPDKQSPEKLDAYWTLYECLTTTARLIAPFTPFLAESLWQNLVVGPAASAGGTKVPESVHLCDYPVGDAAAIDETLSQRMNLVRLIASLGRSARTAANLKVRQPLAKVEVILADAAHQGWLEQHAAVIAEELNVKSVEFSDQPEKYVAYEVLPNFKLLGPKLGKLMPKVKPALAKHSGAALLAKLRSEGRVELVVEGETVELTSEEIEVRIQARSGWAAANDKGVVVVLATELTPELVAEGLARDLVRAIQDVRKERGCEFTDRIEVGVVSQSEELTQALDRFREYISGETLATRIVATPLPNVPAQKTTVGDSGVEIYVQVAS